MDVHVVEKDKHQLLKTYHLTESTMQRMCSTEHSLEIEKFISWESVGPYLKVSRRALRDIDRDGYNEAGRRRLLVDLWYEECGDDATYDAIITAMLKAGKKDEATKVCKLLKPVPEANNKQVSNPWTDLPCIWLLNKATDFLVSFKVFLPRRLRKKRILVSFLVAAVVFLFISLLLMLKLPYGMDTSPQPIPTYLPLRTAYSIENLSTPQPIYQPPAPKSVIYARYAKYLKKVYDKIPVFMPDKLPFLRTKAYINLTLVKKQLDTQAVAREFSRQTIRKSAEYLKEEIEIDKILRTNEKLRVVVVEGAPGIGKSTLALELCQRWRIGNLLRQFPLVVLLRLREDSINSITDLFFHTDRRFQKQVVNEVNKRDGEGVLFIFDGFDELPKEIRHNSLVTRIIRDPRYFPDATILVTLRPSVYSELQPSLQEKFSKRIEVLGFTRESIFMFVSSAFANLSDSTNRVSKFKKYLTANPAVEAMMYNPLNCAIVVDVYHHNFDSKRPVPQTQMQLYTELTLYLLSRYLSARGDPRAKNLPNSLYNLHRHPDLYKQLKAIGELAFQGVRNEKTNFTQLPRNCSNLGLLTEHKSLYSRNETTTFTFFHLTLQEYVSAFYISLKDDSEHRSLFAEQSSSRSMNVVSMFLCGLTKMKTIGWDVFMNNSVEPVDDKRVDISHPLPLQCLYEAQTLENCRTLLGPYETVDFFKAAHTLSPDYLSNYDMYTLGYAISTCGKLWDLELAFTTEPALEMLSHGLNSTKPCRGSINELHLDYSPGVINSGGHLLQMPHEALKTVTMVALGGCKVDQEGFENLARCIPKLPKLIALGIESNPGGAGSLVNLMEKLATHEEILWLTMNGVTIGMDDVLALSKLIQSSSSLQILQVGGSYKNDGEMTMELDKELVRAVLLSSTLYTVQVEVFGGCSVWDHVETVSNNIGFLKLSNRNVSATLTQETKGCTKFSKFLGNNTSLVELKLLIHLNKQGLDQILSALRENQHLQRLQLLPEWESSFPESERSRFHFSLEFKDLIIEPE